MGRPNTYTPAIAEEICERLAGGESLLQMCADDHLPNRATVFRWLLREPAFRDIYARARESWAEHEFEQMMQIADTPQFGTKIKTLPDGKREVIEGDMIEHRRLQVDARKWALARMSPRKYGDRLGLEHGGEGGGPLKVTVEHIRGRTD